MRGLPNDFLFCHLIGAIKALAVPVAPRTALCFNEKGYKSGNLD
jgi:hypothetical protein